MDNANTNPEARMFKMTFKVSRAGGRRLTWTRCYVPGLTDAVCHVNALAAMRDAYPNAQVLTIAPVEG